MEAVARAGGRNSLWVLITTGVIVAHARTDATGDDTTTGVELIEAVNDDIASAIADAAYDTVGCYDAAGARGATVVVPTEAAGERSRSHNQHGEEPRTATVEADVTRPSARASRERLLQGYVGHRRWSSSQDTRGENGRSAARGHYAECDARHGPRPASYAVGR